ncbi:MAG: hypothetical protein KDA89_21995, partial [Planctomycetaceae bacterium]|nr:hypothetical protein [Planctomycetaceae bacterium]
QPSAVAGLARALRAARSFDESLEAQRLAAELAPDNHSYQSAYLYAVSLSPLLSPKEVFQRHAEWGRRIEAQVRPMAVHHNERSADRKLRVGYVSPDFRGHAVMRFVLPFLEAHDRDRFDIVLYSETAQEDRSTQTAVALADAFIRTREMSDEALAKQIQSDGIDILVDLAGHTAENRLPVFAFKPAPVQVSFLGYPGTTGLTRVDYFLTDRIREPHLGVGCYTEHPVMLPHGACCYEALEAAEPTAPPCLKNGYVTFGSSHRPEKISPETLSVWALVLASVPNSRLLLFRDSFRSESLKSQFRQTLQESGINIGRVDFGWELPERHLDIYSRMDIMLDVFPWGSGTTAYDAMWMGVPIPTLAGDRGSCRSTASLLHFAGFPELIAAGPGDYVRIACGLASDHQRLTQLRGTIRPAMKNSVCHRRQFTQDLETAYREIWSRYLTQATNGTRSSGNTRNSGHSRKKKKKGAR